MTSSWYPEHAKYKELNAMIGPGLGKAVGTHISQGEAEVDVVQRADVSL